MADLNALVNQLSSLTLLEAAELKKLLEANVPNFGAVLNGLNLAVSGYYYAQYYDRSYKDYYVVMSKNESQEAAPR